MIFLNQSFFLFYERTRFCPLIVYLIGIIIFHWNGYIHDRYLISMCDEQSFNVRCGGDSRRVDNEPRSLKPTSPNTQAIADFNHCPFHGRLIADWILNMVYRILLYSIFCLIFMFVCINRCTRKSVGTSYENNFGRECGQARNIIKTDGNHSSNTGNHW